MFMFVFIEAHLSPPGCCSIKGSRRGLPCCLIFMLSDLIVEPYDISVFTLPPLITFVNMPSAALCVMSFEDLALGVAFLAYLRDLEHSFADLQSVSYLQLGKVSPLSSGSCEASGTRSGLHHGPDILDRDQADLTVHEACVSP